MNRQLDVLFVEADSSKKAYQGLADVYSAIETPTWSLLHAQSCRSKGYGVAILDCTAERLTDEDAVKRVKDLNPRLIVFVVYGQNPNSGTTNMVGANRLAKALKNDRSDYVIGVVGSHVSALPKETINEYSFFDVAIIGEGVYTIHNLLASDLSADNIKKVNGLCYRDEDGHAILTGPSSLVPADRMDIDLPGYAWDLLPYKNQPLDLYRAHFWHAEFSHEKRTPFAAIYTSLGCRFACSFCMINVVNRTNYADGITAGDSKGMRFWSPDFMLKQYEKLAEMGVRTVRISDEMFFLDKRYYQPLLQGIIDRQMEFRMWSYSRVDTVRKDFLELFKKAGVNWLALGIEAGNQEVRREVSKGTFKDVNIREAVKEVRDHGINVISNYIFGFPEDTFASMQQTLDLALELNTEMVNMYPCQALPGSKLYQIAKQKGWKLPSTPEGYAFLSYESEPLPTNTLSAAEVVRFRDHAFDTYFKHEPYLKLVETKFGQQERRNVEDMAKIRLKRKILGDEPNKSVLNRLTPESPTP